MRRRTSVIAIAILKELSKKMKDFWTKKELSERLGIKVHTLSLWMKDGYIPYYKFRRNVRFKIIDIKEWEQSKRKNLNNALN